MQKHVFRDLILFLSLLSLAGFASIYFLYVHDFTHQWAGLEQMFYLGCSWAIWYICFTIQIIYISWRDGIVRRNIAYLLLWAAIALFLAYIFLQIYLAA